MHAAAVGVLAEGADLALAAARLLPGGGGAPGAARADAPAALGGAPPGEVARLAFPRLAALASYLRALGGGEPGLLRGALRPLLGGAAGGAGLLLALGALCPPEAWGALARGAPAPPGRAPQPPSARALAQLASCWAAEGHAAEPLGAEAALDIIAAGTAAWDEAQAAQVWAIT